MHLAAKIALERCRAVLDSYLYGELMAELLPSINTTMGTITKKDADGQTLGENGVENGEAPDDWQQMTDEASGKPYWSLTRCVLPYEPARFPLPLLPQPPHARAPPAAYTVESRLPAACDRGGARATGTTQRQASPPGPRPRQRRVRLQKNQRLRLRRRRRRSRAREGKRVVKWQLLHQRQLLPSSQARLPSGSR